MLVHPWTDVWRNAFFRTITHAALSSPASFSSLSRKAFPFYCSLLIVPFPQNLDQVCQLHASILFLFQYVSETYSCDRVYSTAWRQEIGNKKKHTKSNGMRSHREFFFSDVFYRLCFLLATSFIVKRSIAAFATLKQDVLSPALCKIFLFFSHNRCLRPYHYIIEEGKPLR